MDLPARVVDRIDRIRAELKARREIDSAGLLAGVRARLDSRLKLTPLAVDADLADKRGPLGLGRVRTVAYSSPELRKVVLAHVALRPVVEGFALTCLPHPDVRAPVFAADLMVLPTQVTVNADAYGARSLTAGLLAPLAASFARLGSGPAKPWSAPLASSEGLHASASPRLVDDLYAALTGALGLYVEALAAAPRGGDARDDQAAFFAAFHSHGPRVGALGRLFGAAWAERFSRLAFE